MGLAQHVDVLAQIAEEFDLGDVSAVSTFNDGGPDVVGLATSRGAYVVKPSYRDLELRLYATVERTLNARGIRQARLMTTPGRDVSSTTGHCVQEWLGGTTTHRPTRKQVESMMRYLAVYLEALGEIESPGELATLDNAFTRVADVEFLLAQVPKLLDDTTLDPAPVNVGLERLSGSASSIAALPLQLVHSDVGPDNVLWQGDDVVSFVDFSPMVKPRLFALACAVYWTRVHGRSELDVEAIASDVLVYDETRPSARAAVCANAFDQTLRSPIRQARYRRLVASWGVAAHQPRCVDPGHFDHPLRQCPIDR